MIDGECFGGLYSESSSNSQKDDMFAAWSRGGGAGRENSQNAYILVYERIVKDPIKLIFED